MAVPGASRGTPGAPTRMKTAPGKDWKDFSGWGPGTSNLWVTYDQLYPPTELHPELLRAQAFNGAGLVNHGLDSTRAQIFDAARPPPRPVPHLRYTIRQFSQKFTRFCTEPRPTCSTTDSPEHGCTWGLKRDTRTTNAHTDSARQRVEGLFRVGPRYLQHMGDF